MMDPQRLGVETKLVLASLNTSALAAKEQKELWSAAVALSIEQYADFFSIEPAVPRRTDKRRERDQLLSLPSDHEGLRPIAGRASCIIEVGLTVMSLNLYAEHGWVAGISDWGDSIDVLFESDVWLRMKAVVERLAPPIGYDTAEAENRPPPPILRNP